MLRRMRITAGLVASLFLVAGLVSGCGESGEGDPQAPAAPQQAPQAPQQ